MGLAAPLPHGENPQGTSSKGVSDNIDELVKSRKLPFSVIPAKAGIQSFQSVTENLDSGFHRSDDFLRDRQIFTVQIRMSKPEIRNGSTGSPS